MWPTEQNRQAWEQRFGHQPEPPARLPDAVRDRLPNVSGKHVLHLPAGNGDIAAELIGLGALVTGIDPSEQALAAARERAPDAVFFQANVDELPLQLQRRRFNLVYAGEGTLAATADLGVLAGGFAGALRKGGRLLLWDWHPVALCVEPVELRWRESYFAEGLWRLGQIVAAITASGLALRGVEELGPSASETGGRLDPRIPVRLLVAAEKTEAGATFKR
jgi:SAM-dependent methyltransferase